MSKRRRALTYLRMNTVFCRLWSTNQRKEAPSLISHCLKETSLASAIITKLLNSLSIKNRNSVINPLQVFKKQLPLISLWAIISGFTLMVKSSKAVSATWDPSLMVVSRLWSKLLRRQVLAALFWMQFLKFFILCSTSRREDSTKSLELSMISLFKTRSLWEVRALVARLIHSPQHWCSRNLESFSNRSLPHRISSRRVEALVIFQDTHC